MAQRPISRRHPGMPWPRWGSTTSARLRARQHRGLCSQRGNCIECTKPCLSEHSAYQVSHLRRGVMPTDVTLKKVRLSVSNAVHSSGRHSRTRRRALSRPRARCGACEDARVSPC